MSFKPDPDDDLKKLYSALKSSSPPVFFNNTKPKRIPSKENMRTILDSALSFCDYILNLIDKINQVIGFSDQLRNFLQNHLLLTSYKSFLGRHFDYIYIIFDKIF